MGRPINPETGGWVDEMINQSGSAAVGVVDLNPVPELINLPRIERPRVKIPRAVVPAVLGVITVLAALRGELPAFSVPVVEADQPKEYKVYIPLYIENRKPIEIPLLGEIVTVDDSSDLSREKRGIDISFRSSGEALAVWHQVDLIDHDNYREGVYHVYYANVAEGKEYLAKVLPTEIRLPKNEVEAEKLIPATVYFDRRTNSPVAVMTPELVGSGWLGSSEGWSANPKVAYNPISKEFVATCWSNGNEEGWPRIEGWRISPEGEVVGELERVGTTEQTWRQFYPDLAVNKDGNNFVVWEEDTEANPGLFRVKGQLYNPEGKTIRESFSILEDKNASLQHPRLVYAEPLDRFLLTCEDPYIDFWGRPNVEILGQWLFPDGRPDGSRFPVSQDSQDKDIHSLAVNHKGGILEAWSSGGKVFGRPILGKDEKGITILGSTLILAQENGYILMNPKVASFEDGGFILAYDRFLPNQYDGREVWGVRLVERVGGHWPILDDKDYDISDGDRGRFKRGNLGISKPFLVASEGQYSAVSSDGGRKAFIGWEHPTAAGSQVLVRSATIPLDR